MELTQLKVLALPFVLLTLVGCATASKNPSSDKVQPAQSAGVIGEAVPGALVQLPVGNSLGMDSIIVDRTYFAASGRECRRLRNSSGMPIQRVACKGKDGVWRFARDLASTTSTHSAANGSAAAVEVMEPLVPSAASDVVVDEADEYAVIVPVESEVAIELNTVETVKMELLANETLWKFAKRTTGNALNWQAIATLNGITDAKTLKSGSLLDVPASLVK